MNEALVMDIREKLHILRGDAIKGRRYYSMIAFKLTVGLQADLRVVLCNIGTLPWYKRRGAASALTRWPFGDADRDKVLVYLDTDQYGVARRIYESLGFQRAGEAVFDLSQYGSTGTHTHIAMLREPQ